MTKKRSRHELYAEALRACNETGENRTAIAYKMRTNTKFAGKTLSKLTENGLIQERDGLHHTTTKGSDYLEAFDEMEALLK